ncbi:hypothetical protein K4F52_004128 [Lecanicillium sp. MT-2017a]|nr:hypothetical protein K4F52_004128 [Lecanicillium sp. MT-2017a]
MSSCEPQDGASAVNYAPDLKILSEFSSLQVTLTDLADLVSRINICPDVISTAISDIEYGQACHLRSFADLLSASCRERIDALEVSSASRGPGEHGAWLTNEAVANRAYTQNGGDSADNTTNSDPMIGDTAPFTPTTAEQCLDFALRPMASGKVTTPVQQSAQLSSNADHRASLDSYEPSDLGRANSTPKSDEVVGFWSPMSGEHSMTDGTDLTPTPPKLETSGSLLFMEPRTEANPDLRLNETSRLLESSQGPKPREAHAMTAAGGFEHGTDAINSEPQPTHRQPTPDVKDPADSGFPKRDGPCPVASTEPPTGTTSSLAQRGCLSSEHTETVTATSKLIPELRVGGHMRKPERCPVVTNAAEETTQSEDPNNEGANIDGESPSYLPQRRTLPTERPNNVIEADEAVIWTQGTTVAASEAPDMPSTPTAASHVIEVEQQTTRKASERKAPSDQKIDHHTGDFQEGVSLYIVVEQSDVAVRKEAMRYALDAAALAAWLDKEVQQRQPQKSRVAMQEILTGMLEILFHADKDQVEPQEWNRKRKNMNTHIARGRKWRRLTGELTHGILVKHAWELAKTDEATIDLLIQELLGCRLKLLALKALSPLVESLLNTGATTTESFYANLEQLAADEGVSLDHDTRDGLRRKSSQNATDVLDTVHLDTFYRSLEGPCEVKRTGYQFDGSCVRLVSGQQWFNDQLILLLVHISEKRPDVRIGTSVAIHRQNDSRRMRDPFEVARKSVERWHSQDTEATTLVCLFPLFLHSNHFSLLEVNEQEETVYHYDSMSSGENEDVKEACKLQFTNMKYVEVKTAQQSDGHSCGPLVVRNCCRRMQGQPVSDEDVSQAGCHAMRAQFLGMLRNAWESGDIVPSANPSGRKRRATGSCASRQKRKK